MLNKNTCMKEKSSVVILTKVNERSAMEKGPLFG